MSEMGANALTFGSLFTGIGGLDLGLERAGIKCAWQVEIDPFCRSVLAKHWPNVARHEDVRLCGAELGRVDLIAGGFPCQDISQAGNRKGIDGERSGLWSEYARIVRELRPKLVLVENVPALLVRGMDRVLGDLSALGYDAEWDCIPALAVGAPHLRDRIFIVAARGRTANAIGNVLRLERERARDRRTQAMANAARERGESRRAGSGEAEIDGSYAATLGRSRWVAEPDVGRMAHGVPNRVDRLRSLGNAVVPQVAEWIGRRIVAEVKE